MARQTSEHVVTLTVVVTAEGLDARDAVNVAEQAVREALTRAPLTTRTYAGHERRVEIDAIAEIGAAFRAGILAVRPTT